MKSIEIIMLPVADQQKAKEFYLKLGFQLIIEAPDAHGGSWIQMGLPGSNTTISLASFSGVICETENIEESIQSLTAQGITVGAVDNTPWGRFAWLSDPDGNRLCLHQR